MISLSVSDIVKLLEQIPIWKAVTGLPKRLAELERRVAELESKAVASLPTTDPKACAICGATMKVVREAPHPTFDFAGVKIHHMSCPECGTTASRDFRPGKGYS